MKQMEFQGKPNLEVGGIKNPNKIEMAFGSTGRRGLFSIVWKQLKDSLEKKDGRKPQRNKKITTRSWNSSKLSKFGKCNRNQTNNILRVKESGRILN
jgi:hypothetical protein